MAAFRGTIRVVAAGESISTEQVDRQDGLSRDDAGKWPGFLVAVILVVVAAAAGFLAHVPGLNGYEGLWAWPWRMLPSSPLYPLLLLGAVPVFLAHGALARGKTTTGKALALLVVGNLGLQIFLCGSQSDPFSLDRIWQTVSSSQSTGYFTDAVRLMQIPGWLSSYPQLLPDLTLHSSTKPPGYLLYYTLFIEVFGIRTGAFWGGLTTGFIGSLAVPATYWLARTYDVEKEGAFHAACLMALAPGLLLFFPGFDQILSVVACLQLAVWRELLHRKSVALAVAFGSIVFVTTFFTYSLLVLGVFLVLWLVHHLRERPDEVGPIAVRIALAVLVFVVLNLALWAIFHFEPIETFRVAVAEQQAFAATRPTTYWRTVPMDIYQGAIGAGFVLVVALVYRFSILFGAEPSGPLERPFLLIALVQIAVVAASMLLAIETTRLWIFLIPLVAIPAGCEVARRPPGERWAALLGQLVLSGVTCQTMVFLRPT